MAVAAPATEVIQTATTNQLHTQRARANQRGLCFLFPNLRALKMVQLLEKQRAGHVRDVAHHVGDLRMFNECSSWGPPAPEPEA